MVLLFGFLYLLFNLWASSSLSCGPIMASSAPISTAVKLVVKLHQGEQTRTKVYRIAMNEQYTHERLTEEVLRLFPDLAAKEIGLKLYYEDDLAGRVYIESDMDVAEAIQSFAAHSTVLDREYLILHAEDYWKSTLPAVDDEVCKPPRKKARVAVEVRYLNYIEYPQIMAVLV